MAKPPYILDGESVEEFTALTESMYAEFAPTSDGERRIVDEMVQHEWYMRRALRMQQTLESIRSADNGGEVDEKRLKLVARYYKTHERAFTHSKKFLESLRKHRRTMDAMVEREANATKKRDHQWEQLLKKMRPLTDWVN